MEKDREIPLRGDLHLPMGEGVLEDAAMVDEDRGKRDRGVDAECNSTRDDNIDFDYVPAKTKSQHKRERKKKNALARAKHGSGSEELVIDDRV